MTPSKALDTTLRRFKLKASDLSRKSGIQPDEISKFRNGHKDFTAQNLFKIIRVMPSYAQIYCLNLCVSESEDTIYC